MSDHHSEDAHVVHDGAAGNAYQSLPGTPLHRDSGIRARGSAAEGAGPSGGGASHGTAHQHGGYGSLAEEPNPLQPHGHGRSNSQSLDDLVPTLPDEPLVVEEVVNGEVRASRTLSVADLRDTKDFWEQVEAGIDQNDAFYKNDLDIKDMSKTKTVPFLKVKDKIYFLLGVSNALFIAYCAGGHPGILPYFYSIKFVLLVGLRFFYYKAQKWQYFLLDFCYWANITLLTYLWFANKSPEVFLIVFALCLVFHSLDKITSASIHITPVILSYVLRWQHAEMWWPGYAVCEPSACPPLFLWLTVIAAACFVGQQVLYWVLIKFVFPLPEDPEYLTSYRYLAGTPDEWAYKYVGFLGDRLRPFTFTLLYCIFSFVCLLPNYFWYTNQTAHLVFVVCMCIALIWNGANFYVEVFARGYKVSAERASNFMILAQ